MKLLQRIIKLINYAIITLLFSTLIQSCGVKLILGNEPKSVVLPIPSDNLYFSDLELENSKWIQHLSCIQCEISYYENLESAMDFLTSHGILIIESKVKVRPGPLSCGHSSEIYYTARIIDSDLETAHNLGWSILSEFKMYKYSK